MKRPSFLFYQSDYGGKLNESEFMRFDSKAACYLDELTMGRINGDLSRDTETKVNLALCAVVDALMMNEQVNGAASETNDGVSVTYEKTGSQRLYEAAAMFLGSTGLLYRGVR